jgi:hypothetical protein
MVMLHAGVCLPRQYATFAYIVLGQKTRDFFERLTRLRFATARPCWRRAGRIYHVHHKGLYRAIGELDNRHRRPATLARAVERLMLLDAVLSDPETTWLGTERDKVGYFLERAGVATDHLPALVFNQRGARTVRHFPNKLPVGLVASDRVTFVFLVTETTGCDSRAFLNTHGRLLRGLRRWTLRLVFPARAVSSQAVHTTIVHEVDPRSEGGLLPAGTGNPQPTTITPTTTSKSVSTLSGCYNPLHNDLEPYALAYSIATLLNNLYGRGKEPFWQQAYVEP